MGALKEKGIETRTFFIPLHQQPAFKPYIKAAAKNSMAVSDAVAKDGFYLPSSSGLTKKQILFITAAIKEIHANNAARI